MFGSSSTETVKLYDLQDYLAMHTTIQCNILIAIDSLNFTVTLTCLFYLILITFWSGFLPILCMRKLSISKTGWFFPGYHQLAITSSSLSTSSIYMTHFEWHWSMELIVVESILRILLMLWSNFFNRIFHFFFVIIYVWYPFSVQKFSGKRN